MTITLEEQLLNIEELVRLQLELECIGVAAGQTLVRIAGPDPDTIARFYIVRSIDGYYSFLRSDLPASLRKSLAALVIGEAFGDQELVLPLLAPHAPCNNISHFITYVFPDSLSDGDHPNAVRLTDAHWRLLRKYDPKIDLQRHTAFALIADDQIVSTCESSRENARAGEAWVRTIPRFRNRGYARQVTAAWAHYLKQQGKVPFYSHRPNNTASRALAKSLGLIHLFDGVAYE